MIINIRLVASCWFFSLHSYSYCYSLFFYGRDVKLHATYEYFGTKTLYKFKKLLTNKTYFVFRYNAQPLFSSCAKISQLFSIKPLRYQKIGFGLLLCSHSLTDLRNFRTCVSVFHFFVRAEVHYEFTLNRCEIFRCYTLRPGT